MLVDRYKGATLDRGYIYCFLGLTCVLAPIFNKVYYILYVGTIDSSLFTTEPSPFTDS